MTVSYELRTVRDTPIFAYDNETRAREAMRTEEKRRGLTIDLGFAHTELASGAVISFVDVPGHVRFLRNMLAGVGAVDACLFVVAATEGWKPQSEEHLRILQLLGMRRPLIVTDKGVVAAGLLAKVKERLPGNIGYLEVRAFYQKEDFEKPAQAAMKFLGNTDALIIDLRRNGGGSLEEAVNLTGLTISKLDGTAKGGILLAIARQLRVPIRLAAVGEGIDDIDDFRAAEFVQALVGERST